MERNIFSNSYGNYLLDVLSWLLCEVSTILRNRTDFLFSSIIHSPSANTQEHVQLAIYETLKYYKNQLILSLHSRIFKASN